MLLSFILLLFAVRILGKQQRTIWREGSAVHIIDQTSLPHRFATRELRTVADMVEAIAGMRVRGAPLIGVAAAYGVALALLEGVSLSAASEQLAATRPTAVNLRWALTQMRQALTAQEAFAIADRLADEDAAACRRIGENGADLFAARASELGRSSATPLQVMTHCNAGFLATVDWGTALAAIYVAHERGVPLHVWVSETRPRSQGMLTAWELQAAGVPHTLIADNMSGHLLQTGRVDLCVVGSDRTTANGDVCNKIGTYMKAVCAREAGVPFYVALPQSTVDLSLASGAEIPIEARSEDEVHWVGGARVSPAGSRALNLGFDVTPARLVTALITEVGICDPAKIGAFLSEAVFAKDFSSTSRPHGDLVSTSRPRGDVVSTSRPRGDVASTSRPHGDVEGVVKFQVAHTYAALDAQSRAALPALLVARELLFRLGVIGQDPARYDGAGFGNVSVRLGRGFLVSGTQTSGSHPAREDEFCVVDGQDFARNEVRSHGPCRPSSESLTHAMIYEVAPSVRCVLHGHCPEIWRNASALAALTTAADVPYGTMDMADAVRALHDTGALGEQGVLCMLGHQDGVIVFATTPAEAAQLWFTTLARALAR